MKFFFRICGYILFLTLFYSHSCYALTHYVTDFRLDFSGALADTMKLNPGWGDSLVVGDSFYSYKSVLTKNLTDNNSTNGGAGASTIAACYQRYGFKAAYLAWRPVRHNGDQPGPLGLAVRANIVMRDISILPDTVIVKDSSDILVQNENIPDTAFPYQNPSGLVQVPPAPYYFNFAAEGGKYSAYWSALTPTGPVRRTTFVESQAGGNSANWGKYVTPLTNVKVGNYGTVSACIVPGSGGAKTALVYEVPSAAPTSKFEVRWEDLDNVTSITAPKITRPTHIPDDFGIAADSSGNVLVLFRDTTKLYALAYNNSQTLILDTTLIASGIYYDNDSHKHRPYAVASMVNGKFLLV